MIVAMDSLVSKPDGTEFHWTLTGTNSGPGGTGKKVKISGFEVWQVLGKMDLYKNPSGRFDADEYNAAKEQYQIANQENTGKTASANFAVGFLGSTYTLPYLTLSLLVRCR